MMLEVRWSCSLFRSRNSSRCCEHSLTHPTRRVDWRSIIDWSDFTMHWEALQGRWKVYWSTLWREIAFAFWRIDCGGTCIVVPIIKYSYETRAGWNMNTGVECEKKNMRERKDELILSCSILLRLIRRQTFFRSKRANNRNFFPNL